MDEITVAFGSGASTVRAVAWAVARAEREALPLRLVRIVDDTAWLTDTPIIADAMTIGREELDAEGDRLRHDHPSVDVRLELVRGDLLTMVRDLVQPGTLVVVGVTARLGWGGRGRSVAARIVRHPAGPVAIVPDVAAAPGAYVVAGVDPRDDGTVVASFAADEATATGLPLHVVSAWSRSAPVADDDVGPGEPLLLSVFHRHPELRIERTRAHSSGFEALIEASEGASLLVVGAPRYAGWQRIVHGSTSAELVLETSVPMIVVPVVPIVPDPERRRSVIGPSALRPEPREEQTSDMTDDTTPESSVSTSSASTAPRSTSGGEAANAPIVVGIDGSPNSTLALRAAARLARLLDAPLEALLAWQYPNIPYVGYLPDGDWMPEQDAKALITGPVEAVFGQEPPEWFSAATRMGGPAPVLIDAGRRARLVVVGGRGHGGFAGLLLGSVSEAVTRHAPCPVLVLHGDALDPFVPATADDQRPVLVGVDGSPESLEALRFGADLARRLESPLHVLLAWEDPLRLSGGYPLALEWSPEEDARSALQSCLDQVFSGHPPAGTTTGIQHGAPVPVLLEAAAKARLLVVGSRGRGGFAGLLLGSATEGCVRHSPVPVLVAPGPRALDERSAVLS